MPIYEYRCEACGTELEKLRKISDPPLLDCPACGKPALAKLVSASSFRLKGSGWYETDFKTGKKKNGVADGTADSAGTSEAAGKEPAGKESASTGKEAGKESGSKESGSKESGKSADSSKDNGGKTRGKAADAA